MKDRFAVGSFQDNMKQLYTAHIIHRQGDPNVEVAGKERLKRTQEISTFAVRHLIKAKALQSGDKIEVDEYYKKIRVSNKEKFKSFSFKELGILFDKGSPKSKHTDDALPQVTVEAFAESLVHNIPFAKSARLRYLKDAVLDRYAMFYFTDYLWDTWKMLSMNGLLWNMLSLPERIFHYGLAAINLLGYAYFSIRDLAKNKFPQLKREFTMWMFQRNKVPLSLIDAMEGVIQFLEMKRSQSAEYDQVINEYKACRRIALELEKIKGWTVPFQVSGVKRLAERQGKAISQLNEGQRHLVPGGVYKNGQFIPFLYEFERGMGEEKDKCLVRIIDVHGTFSSYQGSVQNEETGKLKAIPYISFTMDLARASNAEDVLQPLLELQLPAAYAEFKAPETIEMARAFLQTGLLKAADRVESLQDHWAIRRVGNYAIVPALKGLSGVTQVISNCFGFADLGSETLERILPELQKLDYPKNPEPDDPKLMKLAKQGKGAYKTAWALLKLRFPDQCARLQLELKYTVLCQLFENEKALLSKDAGARERAVIRECIQEWADLFEKSAPKLFANDDIQLQEVHGMNERLEGILQQIQKMEEGLVRPVKELVIPKRCVTTNHGSVGLSALAHVDGYAPIPAKSLAPIISRSVIDWAQGPSVSVAAFEGYLKEMDALCKKGDDHKWEAIDVAAVDLLRQLPIPTVGESIDPVWDSKMTPEQISHWQELVHRAREYVWKANHIRQTDGVTGVHAEALARSAAVSLKLAMRNKDVNMIGPVAGMDLSPFEAITDNKTFYFASKEQEDSVRGCLDFMREVNKLSEKEFPLSGIHLLNKSLGVGGIQDWREERALWIYVEAIYQKIHGVFDFDCALNPAERFKHLREVSTSLDYPRLPGVKKHLSTLKAVLQKLPPKDYTEIAKLKTLLERLPQAFEFTGEDAAIEGKLKALSDELNLLREQLKIKKDIPLTSIGKMYPREISQVTGGEAKKFYELQQKAEILADLGEKGYNHPDITHLRLCDLQLKTMLSNRNCYYERGVMGLSKEAAFQAYGIARGEVRLDKFSKDFEATRRRFISYAMSKKGEPYFSFRREGNTQSFIDYLASYKWGLDFFLLSTGLSLGNTFMAGGIKALLMEILRLIFSLEFWALGGIFGSSWLIYRNMYGHALVRADVMCEPYGLCLGSWDHHRYDFARSRDAEGIGKPYGGSGDDAFNRTRVIREDVVGFRIGADDYDPWTAEKTEQKVIADAERIGELTLEQSRDLQRTRLNAAEIGEVLDYYSDNPLLLEEGPHQHLLERALTRYGKMTEALGRQPELVARFNRFFSKQLNWARMGQKVQEQLFLARLSERVNTYISDNDVAKIVFHALPKEGGEAEIGTAVLRVLGELERDQTLGRSRSSLNTELLRKLQENARLLADQTGRLAREAKEARSALSVRIAELEGEIRRVLAAQAAQTAGGFQIYSRNKPDPLEAEFASLRLKQEDASARLAPGVASAQLEFVKGLDRFGDDIEGLSKEMLEDLENSKLQEAVIALQDLLKKVREGIPNRLLSKQILDQCVKQCRDGTAAYLKHLVPIHAHIIAAYASYSEAELQSLGTEELLSVIKSFFVVRGAEEDAAHRDPVFNDSVNEAVLKLMPIFKGRLSDDATKEPLLNAILRAVHPEATDQKWEGTSTFFTCKDWEIDIANGRVYHQGYLKTELPYSVLKNEGVLRLFGGGPIPCKLQCSQNSYNKSQVRKFTFEKGGDHYSIIQRADESIAIYKEILNIHTGVQSWHQWIHQEMQGEESKVASAEDRAGRRTLPKPVTDNICWVDCDQPAHFLICDEGGKELYRGTLRGKSIYSLYNLKYPEGENTVLRVWGNKSSLEALTRIAPPEQIEVLGTAEGAPKTIVYHNYNQSFSIDEEGIAHSGNDAHFVLTDKQKLNVRGLGSHFQHFQVVKHDEDQIERVLIPASEIAQTVNSLSAQAVGMGVDAVTGIATGGRTPQQALGNMQKQLANVAKTELIKQGLWLIFKTYMGSRLSAFFGPDTDSKAETPEVTFKYQSQSDLLAFEIDPYDRRFKTKNKESYLYLSYMFLAYGKHKEALYYLKQAKTSLAWSDKAKDYIRLMQQWPDDSAASKAFKLQLELMFCENQMSLLGDDLKKKDTSFKGMRTYITLMGLQVRYEEYQEIEKKLPGDLHLTSGDKRVYMELLSQLATITGQKPKPTVPIIPLAEETVDPSSITPPHLDFGGNPLLDMRKKFSSTLYYAQESKRSSRSTLTTKIKFGDEGFKVRAGRELIRNFDVYLNIATTKNPGDKEFDDLCKRLDLMGDKIKEVQMARWYLHVATELRRKGEGLSSIKLPEFKFEYETKNQRDQRAGVLPSVAQPGGFWEKSPAASPSGMFLGRVKDSFSWAWDRIKKYTFWQAYSLVSTSELDSRYRQELVDDIDKVCGELDSLARHNGIGSVKKRPPRGGARPVVEAQSEVQLLAGKAEARRKLQERAAGNSNLGGVIQGLGGLDSLGGFLQQVISQGAHGITSIQQMIPVPFRPLLSGKTETLHRIEEALDGILEKAEEVLAKIPGSTRDQKRDALMQWLKMQVSGLGDNPTAKMIWAVTGPALGIDLEVAGLIVEAYSESIIQGILLVLDTRTPSAVKRHWRAAMDKEIDLHSEHLKRLDAVEEALNKCVKQKIPSWEGIFTTRGVEMSREDYFHLDTGIPKLAADAFKKEWRFGLDKVARGEVARGELNPEKVEIQVIRNRVRTELGDYLCGKRTLPPKWLFNPEAKDLFESVIFLHEQLQERLPGFLCPVIVAQEKELLFDVLKTASLIPQEVQLECITIEQVNKYFENLKTSWTGPGGTIPPHRKRVLDREWTDAQHTITEKKAKAQTEGFKLPIPKTAVEAHSQLGEIKILRDQAIEKGQELQKKAEDSRTKALRLINDPPLTPLKQAYQDLHVLVDKHEEVFFPEVKRLWLQGRLFDLCKKNPQLTHENLAELEGFVTEHLQAGNEAVQAQRLCRAFQSLEEGVQKVVNPKGLSKEKREQLPLKIKEAHSLITQQLSLARTYKVDSSQLYSRACLMIENVKGYVLRPEQVEVFYELSRDPTKVKQLIMGSGKTEVGNVVIMLMLAMGNNLPRWIGPKALFNVNSRDLDSICPEHFGQELYRFEFERNMLKDAASVQKIYHREMETMAGRGFAMNTRESMQCAELYWLKNIEDLEKAPVEATEDLESQDKYLTELLKMWRKRGYILNDEVDSVNDPTHQYIFACGASEKLGKQPIKINAALNMMRLILKNQEWKERLKIKNNLQQNLSEKDHEELRLFVANCFFDECVTKGSLKEENREEFILFVTGDQRTVKIPACVTLSPDKEFFKEVAVVKTLLTTIVEGALSKKGNVNYGPEMFEEMQNGKKVFRRGRWVVPYIAHGKQRPGSIHGNELERIIFHILSYLQLGVTFDQIKERRDTLQAEAITLKQSEQYAPGATSPEQQWRSYGWTGEVALLDVTDEDLRGVVETLNSTEGDLEEESILKYLEQVLLPEMEIHGQTLESNSQNFGDQNRFFAGFSGTVGKIYALNDKITEKSKTARLGTNGETLEAILRKSNNGMDEVDTYGGETAEERVKELLEKCKGANFFVDGGAALDCTDPQEFAARCAEEQSKIEIRDQAHKIVGVVFFNKEDSWVVQFVGQDHPTPVEDVGGVALKNLFTLYDHGHRIGAHRLQDASAEFVATGGAKTDFEDAAQSWARARGLWTKKQKPRHLVSDETRKLIKGKESKEPLLVGEYVGHLFANQADEEAKANYKASRHKIMNIMRSALISSLLDAPDAYARRDLLKCYKEHLFKTSSENYIAMLQVEKMDTPENALKALIEAEQDKITGILGALPERLLGGQEGLFKAAYQRLEAYKEPSATGDTPGILPPEFYPEKVPMHESSAQTEVTVEQEQEAEQEAEEELDLETKKQVAQNNFKSKWKPWLTTGRSSPLLYRFMSETTSQLDSKLGDEFKGVFDKRVLFSPNMIPQGERALWGYQKPIHDLLVVYGLSGKAWTVIACDALDKDRELEDLFKKHKDPDIKIGHYSMREKKMQRWSNAFSDEELGSEGFLRLTVQCHFFNAETHYQGIVEKDSRKNTEYSVLQKWLSEHPHDKMIKLYKSSAAVFRDKAQKYEKSVLSKGFASIKSVQEAEISRRQAERLLKRP